MKYNNLVLISGPAASGKTTLKMKLLDHFNAYSFRPSDAYIILAKQRNICVEQAFSAISRYEAETYFCNLCKEYTWVIGDQHLAIQFTRDSQIAVSFRDTCEINEEYSRAVSKDLIMRLKNDGVNILILLLKASPIELLKRARNRFREIGHIVRNMTEDDVNAEVEAEISFFNELVIETGIDHFVIDTTSKSDQEVYAYALQKTQEFSEKINGTARWIP